MKSLSKRHRRQLEQESGIAPEVIEQRGYRTVRNREELIGASGKYVAAYLELPFPGLYIPLWPVPHADSSDREGAKERPYLYRPDAKWTPPDGSKRGKYVNPPRQRNYVDVHPINAEALTNSDRGVVLTEGTKKADAATSHGLLTVGLSGVFNWKYLPRENGRRVPRGESLPCPEWSRIPFERDWTIVFDSDPDPNPDLASNRQRLTNFLYERGADRVFWIELPKAPDGSKGALDSFLAAGSGAAGLRALPRTLARRSGRSRQGVR